LTQLLPQLLPAELLLLSLVLLPLLLQLHMLL
jgi:hypothetical protein